MKDRFRTLRESLAVEDRALLVLRVDRNLPWADVARVMLGTGGHPDAEALSRETARLRKRFQVLKLDLRKQADAAGLLNDLG